MSLTALASDPAVLATFDRVCALVAEKRTGITMRQLGAAHALARELCATKSDPGKLADHAHALGLDVEALR